MSENITFTSRERIDEGSTLVVTARFFHDDAASAPGNLWYRLDELTTARKIVDWTEIDVSAEPTAVPLLITASQNLCERGARWYGNERIVRRRLTMVSDRSTYQQCARTFTYEIVRNPAIDVIGSVTEDVAGPADPVLTASRTGTTVSLSWTAAAVLDGTVNAYQIWKADGPTLLATVDAATFAHDLTNQSENTEFDYYVIAETDIGGKSVSNPQIVDIGGPQAPTLSGSLTGGGNDDVALTWTAATTGGGPITGYHVFQDGAQIHATDAMTLAYTVTGLTDDTAYVFAVTAITAQSESELSNQLGITTGHPSTIIDIFTNDGTWSKRVGLESIDIYGIGGGGSGAGGGANSHSGGGTPNNGGGGGAGGGYFSFSLAAADCPSSVSITVGAGGVSAAGGTDSTGVSAAGVQGNVGGATKFGSGATANGGSGGITSHITPAQSFGGTASVTQSGATSVVTETGGKGAEGNTNGVGGNGVAGTNAGSGGGSGGSNAGPNAGGTGPANTDSSGYLPSTGGDGGTSGSASSPATGTPGADGSGFGSGGGGGGDMVNVGGGFNLMKGGDSGAGAPGKLVVVNHLS